MLDKNLIPETIPFDFDENYKAVKDVLSSYGYDIQEGSNSMQIAIAMSYLVSMLNANTAVNINEMLLPLARKRKMVLQNARLLGYEIQHIMSYKYKLTLEFPEGIHQIDKYEKFTSNDKEYYYMDESIPAFEGPRTLELIVAEGKLKQWKTDDSLVTKLSVSVSGREKITDYFVDVPYQNVAENGLKVFVSYTDPTGIEQEMIPYERMDNFLLDTDSRGKKGYVRLDNIEFKTPRIYFKLGGIGNDLPQNTIVRVDALVSSGSKGKLEGDLKTELDCEITNIELHSNGSDDECTESIRRNAPMLYNSANRLVTKNDIRYFVLRESKVSDSVAWDGNDEYPYRPGNIWFSTLPAHTNRSYKNNEVKTIWELSDKSIPNWYLTNQDIKDILNNADKSRIPTINLHHRHPTYLEFDYKIQIVRYNRSKTPGDLNEEVFNTINNYFLNSTDKEGAETFNFEYFQSNLDKRIDKVLTDSTGFNIELNTSIVLTEQDIINETLTYCDNELNIKNEIRFHLGTPYEKYIGDDRKVVPEYLPRISSQIDGEELFVDFSDYDENDRLAIFTVYLGDKTIGEYRVFKDTSDTIEVVLASVTDLEFMELENGVKIDIKYNSPNFKVTRNTIPLLNKVEFITR